MRRAAMLVGGIVTTGALALIVAYRLSHRETEELSPDLRAELGGRYVTLSTGVTRYAVDAPDGAPPEAPLAKVVVMVHGGTIPHWNFNDQVPALTAAGYTVLRYDLFGRGHSDRPAVPYDRGLYRRQLEELLDKLEVEGPVDLVGISFGGATIANFAASNPDKVRKMVFLAPVVHYAEGKKLFSLASVPGLGEWYARVISVPGTISRATSFFEESGADPSFAELFDEQTRYVGYERALLSMSRTDALTDYRPVYEALETRPTLLVWGDADEEIPRAHVDFLRRTLAEHEYLELPGAGHGLNIQRRDEVNRAIVDFLD